MTTVEIDVIIKNNTTILCEIKSACSVEEVEKFAKKIKFYEKKEKVKVSRKIIISAWMRRNAKQEASSVIPTFFTFAP